MSEDPSFPSLRLKPRLHPDGNPPVDDALPPASVPLAGAAAAAAPTSVAVAPPPPPAPQSGEANGLSLKLRPRTGAAVAPVLPAGPAPIVPPSVEPSLPAAAPAPALSSPVASMPPPVVSPTGPGAPPPTVSALPPPVAANSPSPAPKPPVAPTPSAPTAAPAASGEAVDPSRFKLKPRAGVPEGVANPVPPGVISTKPLLAGLPPLPATPPPLPPSAAAPAVAVPGALPKASTAVPPSIKVVAPGSPVVAAPPAPRVMAPSAANEVAPAPENSRAFKVGVGVVSALVVVLLATGGFLGYRFLHPKKDPASELTAGKPAAAKPAPTPTPAPAPVPAIAKEPTETPAHDPVVASPQSLPGRLVGKARDVVAARDQSGQVSGVGEIMGDPPDTPTPAPSRTAKPKAPVAARNIPLDASTPPQESAVDKPAAPPPGIAFRTFVANLRVSGVFQGEPGRALLNGHTISVGEFADTNLGIRLIRLDPERKLLYFEDNNGSTMQRRY